MTCRTFFSPASVPLLTAPRALVEGDRVAAVSEGSPGCETRTLVLGREGRPPGPLRSGASKSRSVGRSVEPASLQAKPDELNPLVHSNLLHQVRARLHDCQPQQSLKRGSAAGASSKAVFVEAMYFVHEGWGRRSVVTYPDLFSQFSQQNLEACFFLVGASTNKTPSRGADARALSGGGKGGVKVTSAP